MREVEIDWRLRQVMAQRGLFSTTDLQPLLSQRGVNLSATQVYRLVTQCPERLNMRVLAAACDALGCSPDELIGVRTVEKATPQVANAGPRARAKATGQVQRPRRVTVTPEE
ncbi:MAG: helix-turn-helix transcriptional regulator [Micrococcales bacterium]|nr:helix-turn-helix transcriptional regulator [Micrococcales bacterium]